ncbi:MAG: hypothetical protein GF317_06110 [Candidatus Lokiarchaeota archaeon]|nr:hypothetical protein [Candidatus Lokiarchaeota archaeon]
MNANDFNQISDKNLANLFSVLTKYSVNKKLQFEESEVFQYTESKEISKSNYNVDLLEENINYKIQTNLERETIKFFEDGTQQTQHLADVPCDKYNKLVPILFSSIGAIILEYKDNKLSIYNKPKFKEYLITPELSLLSNELREIIQKIENIIEIDKEIIKDSDNIRTYVSTILVSNLRKKMEDELIINFNKETNNQDWLVIDGIIQSNHVYSKEATYDKKIGMIKRIREKWISDKDFYNILKQMNHVKNKPIRSMKFGLTRVTSPASKKILELISCYSKLYNYNMFKNTDYYFSLFRFEILKKYKELFDNLLVSILDFSVPIPPTTSDSWDKKIYPIYRCEQYLNTLSSKNQTRIRNIIGSVI